VSAPTQVPVFYFGADPAPNSGHRLWQRAPGTRGHTVVTLREERALLPSFLGSGVLDGRLAPEDTRKQGRARLLHLHGWTTLSFWDCTVDTRGGSVSTFVVRGTHGFDEIVALARAAFPQVWARFAFEVVEHPEPPR
jgi:hypothetical protein